MRRLTQTHTFAELEVSRSTFDEIAAKLREAGYDHVFMEGLIDMHGIALAAEQSPLETVTLQGVELPLDGGFTMPGKEDDNARHG